jgi:transcriptional regulator with XRE-family HTH domain
MKSINIATVISNNRREMGITQEELANHTGVTKASVSKWETGLSYPDLEMIPVLAAFFDITVDELIGYSPQMSRAQIAETYAHLMGEFAKLPFADVYAECETLIKAYYSCYPLLLNLAILLINHHMLADTPKVRQSTLEKSISLCRHIRKESRDAALVVDTTAMEAAALLISGKATEALELLEPGKAMCVDTMQLIAQAHRMLGETDKAKSVLQAELLKSLYHCVGYMVSLLPIISATSTEQTKLYIERMIALIELFHLDNAVPAGLVNSYTEIAVVAAAIGERETALDMLGKAVSFLTPDALNHILTPNADDFFDGIQAMGWSANFPPTPPRDASVIRKSMLNDVLKSSVFQDLRESAKYQELIRRLEQGRDVQE